MPRKLDFASLELFVAVCEHRSINHAATLANITASAVSKRITRLEEFAGTPLLVRTNSGVTPTNEGVALLEHARNLLYNLEILERDIGSTASRTHGCLLVVANRSANAALVPGAVTSFLGKPKNRDIDVQISEATSHEVVSRVKDAHATLGVCWAETDMAGLEWRPGKRDHLSAVVPLGHPLADRDRIAFAETLRYDQVGIHSGGPVTHRLRRESVVEGKLLRYRIVAPTFDAMVRMVETGLVIAIIPALIALRYARAARVAVVPLTDAWRERQFAVCCRSRRALPRPAAELFNHLVAWTDDPGAHQT